MLQKYQSEMPIGEEAGFNLDPWHYYEIFKRRFLFFIVPFVVFLVGGLIVVVVLPPVYVSEGKVLVELQRDSRRPRQTDGDDARA